MLLNFLDLSIVMSLNKKTKTAKLTVN